MTDNENTQSDEELINAPAHGVQPGHLGAEADARHGLPTGTTPPIIDPDGLMEPPKVVASQIDPDTEVDAVAGDLKPDTEVEDV